MIEYMQQSRGATLHARFPMEHIQPDYEKCLTDPNYYPIAESVPEWGLQGYVESVPALIDLIGSVCRVFVYGLASVVLTESWLFPPKPNSYATCGFFTRDAIYTFFAGPDQIDYTDLIFPRNRSFVLLGVNQVKQQKAVYSNIFLTAVAAPQQVGPRLGLDGPCDWFDRPTDPDPFTPGTPPHPQHTNQVGRTVNFSAPALEGSATWYKPDLAQGPELFAQILTRDDCNKRPPATQEDTFEPFCTTVPEATLNTTEFVFVVERKYLCPITKIGPDPKEVLVPRVLVFETPGAGVEGMMEGVEDGTEEA